MRTSFVEQRPVQRLGRRAWLRNSVLFLAAAESLRPWSLLAAESEPMLRLGLMTDLHYADKPAAGTRHYRETLDKLAEAARQYERDQLDAVVELGDLIDAAESVETELEWLRRVNRDFSKIAADRHYVMGNHCVDTLTKQEFLSAVEQQSSYYSFDRGEFHFIVLDCCFRHDGQPYGRRNFQWTDANIPEEEFDWLRNDLAATDKRTIVFAHQRLDVSDDHGVKNGAAVRDILSLSGRVLAVFQGHSHQNDLKEIDGIHFCTLAAMVEGSGPESNGYARLDIFPDGTLSLAGFRRQMSYRWPYPV